jgi:hypothetical protein
MANRIAALLLKNRKAEAHQAVVEALLRFPDEPDLALQRLLATRPGETVEAIWRTLPDATRKKQKPILIAL